MQSPTLSLVKDFKPNLNLTEGYKKVSRMAPSSLQIPSSRNKNIPLLMMNDMANERTQRSILSNPVPPALNSVPNDIKNNWEKVYGMASPIMQQYGLSLIDGIRDPERASSRSAPNSMHYTGSAIDMNYGNLPEGKKISLVNDLRSAGFTGFGLGSNTIHADIGRPRHWWYTPSGVYTTDVQYRPNWLDRAGF